MNPKTPWVWRMSFMDTAIHVQYGDIQNNIAPMAKERDNSAVIRAKAKEKGTNPTRAGAQEKDGGTRAIGEAEDSVKRVVAVGVG